MNLRSRSTPIAGFVANGPTVVDNHATYCAVEMPMTRLSCSMLLANTEHLGISHWVGPTQTVEGRARVHQASGSGRSRTARDCRVF